jgi:hypothetical protein
VEAKEAWTAFPDSDKPAVQISKTANDGRTVFLGGCNKLLGPGFTGTFASYQGNALKKIDDQSEPVVFEIERAGTTERFPGQIHYYGADSAWVITGLLPPAFVAAFGRGDTLTVRNSKDETAFSFDLLGSSKAARTMQQVCGFAATASTSQSSRTAASSSDSWTATSTTATAITGDIQISTEGIRFENGKTLELAATNQPGVLRVVKRENPVLKNDNLLCGQQPPTFVVYGRDERTESLDGSSNLYLKVYNGSQTPPGSDAIGLDHKGSGFCALYNYTR